MQNLLSVWATLIQSAIISVGNPRQFACFFHLSPTKDLAPFSIHAPQKTLF